jgi:thiamine pyrophosphate-dependent acetolactate synthase large subunit-like protein
MSGGLGRELIVAIVAEVAAERQWPVVVGNGYLCRTVMGLSTPGLALLPLQGGMGLASGVAAGIAASSGRLVVALEGDGNHLMGWAGAQLLGHLGLPVVHVVCWNGTFHSTGAQPLPTSLHCGSAAATASVLGYGAGHGVASAGGLRAALTAEGKVPRLVYVAEDQRSPPPPRVDRPSSAYSYAMRAWIARNWGSNE